MGIDLSEAAIIDDEDLNLNLIDADEIEAELRDRGLQAFPQPEGQPEGLANIDVNDLTNDQLAGLFAQYIAYQAFLSTEVARAKVQKSAADRNLKTVTATLKAAFHAKGVKEKEIVEKVRLHQLYREYDSEYAQARYRFEILESYDRAYGKQASALSRCVELRKIELEQMKRGENINRRGIGFDPKGGPVTRPHRRKTTKAPNVRGKGKKSADAD